MGEHLTLIFVLSGSRLKKSTLVGCDMKKLHFFNRDAQRHTRLVKAIRNLSQIANDFIGILTENSKMPFFYLRFLVSGPTFYELATCISFFLK